MVGVHDAGITIRTPCANVGHGSMYHSQSPEAYFAHCPVSEHLSPTCHLPFLVCFHCLPVPKTMAVLNRG